MKHEVILLSKSGTLKNIINDLNIEPSQVKYGNFHEYIVQTIELDDIIRMVNLTGCPIEIDRCGFYGESSDILVEFNDIEGEN